MHFLCDDIASLKAERIAGGGDFFSVFRRLPLFLISAGRGLIPWEMMKGKKGWLNQSLIQL